MVRSRRALAWVAGAALACALRLTAYAEDAPRHINITPDSAPGWVPSLELERAAQKTVLDFLALKDRGQAAEAFALLTELNRRDTSLTTYTRDLARFSELAGPVVERRIAAVTWTKDPAKAPVPGVYAAVDLVSRFTNVDRHCGYLILYQPPAGGAFGVMREEEAYIPNGLARLMEEKESKAALDESWARLSSRCSNTVSPSPLAEKPGSSIGYPTAAAALADLRTRPGVTVTTQDGWTIATDDVSHTLWSFPPVGHPAYPSAVKRQVVYVGNDLSLQMNVQCEASKDACDDLIRAFQQLNARIEQDRPRKR